MLNIKDAEDEAYYGWDFVRLIGGDTITSAEIIPADTGITAGPPIISGTTVRALISGGVLRATHEITCVAHTSGGETFNRKQSFQIADL